MLQQEKEELNKVITWLEAGKEELEEEIAQQSLQNNGNVDVIAG